MARSKKPRVTIAGHDNGDAAAIMALCIKAAKRAGWTPEQIAEVIAEMKAGDYGHLLRVVMLNFVLNSEVD